MADSAGAEETGSRPPAGGMAAFFHALARSSVLHAAAPEEARATPGGRRLVILRAVLRRLAARLSLRSEGAATGPAPRLLLPPPEPPVAGLPALRRAAMEPAPRGLARPLGQRYLLWELAARARRWGAWVRERAATVAAEIRRRNARVDADAHTEEMFSRRERRALSGGGRRWVDGALGAGLALLLVAALAWEWETPAPDDAVLASAERAAPPSPSEPPLAVPPANVAGSERTEPSAPVPAPPPSTAEATPAPARATAATVPRLAQLARIQGAPESGDTAAASPARAARPTRARPSAGDTGAEIRAETRAEIRAETRAEMRAETPAAVIPAAQPLRPPQLAAVPEVRLRIAFLGAAQGRAAEVPEGLRTALMRWQAAEGLPVTGYLDGMTVARLDLPDLSEVRPERPRRAARRPDPVQSAPPSERRTADGCRLDGAGRVLPHQGLRCEVRRLGAAVSRARTPDEAARSRALASAAGADR